MSVRKLPSPKAAPFFLAPFKEEQPRKPAIKELPLVRQSPTTRKNSKGPRNHSPKSPFSDLNDLLLRLSRKENSRKPAQPYQPSKHHYSPPPKQFSPCASPKHRASPTPKSSKPGSPRPSVAPSRLAMQLDQGVIKSPKIYANQIFRDVFDPTGGHDKELYSTFNDPSLEMYQETKGKAGICVVVPSCLTRKHIRTASMGEMGKAAPHPLLPPKEQESPSQPLGPELWRKLSHLQDLRGNSESETACEECKDSRKQLGPR